MHRSTKLFADLALATLIPSAVYAQDASITGTVRDSVGGVLAGVTVEAASPALIEKVRVVTTDGNGLYRIVSLGPGIYAVTFTLSGFSTVRREGIELTGSFTATVNADLRVGALAETVTITGESPVVDTQGVEQQRVLNRRGRLGPSLRTDRADSRGSRPRGDQCRDSRCRWDGVPRRAAVRHPWQQHQRLPRAG